ncbi:D-aspartate oxidase-like [Dysidea avara]|uniref:D-aspartate oxidase-like n=1 Tax=Dysidea avara TaxID=196820 RepID=UPI0033235AD6
MAEVNKGKRPNVAVVGAGVVGLPTAVMLTESKLQPQVTIIAEQFSPNITSDAAVAAIRITDYQTFANDPRKVKWIGETYQYLSKLFPTPLAARLNLTLLSSYAIFDEYKEYPGVRDLVLGFRFISAEEKRVLNIPQDKTACSYLTFTVPCGPFLAWQLEQFKTNGGMVIQKKLNSLKEIDGEYDVIVNCTGLGSKELVDDQELYPNRGQAMLVKAPWVKYVIKEEFDGGSFSIYPRSEGVVLGGTKQIDNWSTDVDPVDSANILAGCLKYVPSLAQAEVLHEWVGLRPGRKQVRLEAEDLSENTVIVHNYGHNNKGFALSIGCAKDTVLLVEKHLNERGF